MAIFLTLALAGCGAPGDRLSPVGIVETNWTVIEINDRPTPGTGYFITFAGSEIAAQFGCNRISGRWRLNGDHLSTSDLVQTEMGCPRPAETFERLGSAVLRSNMRIERTSGEQIRLVGEAGSIDLRRAI